MKPDEWECVVQAVRETTGVEHRSYACLMQYGVCPFSAVTPLSVELHNVVNTCDGFSRVVRPSDYYQLPAIYVEAVQIIQRVRMEIEEVRRGNQD